MSYVLGKDVVLSFFDGSFYKPAACALDCTMSTKTNFVETSVEGAGNFKTVEPTQDSWSVSANGLVSLEEVNQLDIAELRVKQFAHEVILMHFTRTSVTGQIYEDIGYVYIESVEDTGVYNGMNTFSINLIGTGVLTQSFVPSPVVPPNNEMRLEFPLADGEDTYTNPVLVGKKIVEVFKSGLGIMNLITTGTPAPEQAKIEIPSTTGSIVFGTVSAGEKYYCMYQDI